MQPHLVHILVALSKEFSLRLVDIFWELTFEGIMQEKIIGENYYLNQSAKDAYRSYILAYNSHSMKQIFNVHHLNLKVLNQTSCLLVHCM